jgi:hemoglobin
MNASRALFLCALLATFAACSKKLPPPQVAVVEIAPPPAPPPLPPLFERLGGHDGVAGIVDSFLGNVVADTRVNKYFAKTTGPKLDFLKAMLIAEICDISGGGCEYPGKSMKDAHAGMKITDTAFEAFVQDMGLALQEKQVPDAAQKELLDKLTAMHDDVVGPKAK